MVSGRNHEELKPFRKVGIVGLLAVLLVVPIAITVLLLIGADLAGVSILENAVAELSLGVLADVVIVGWIAWRFKVGGINWRRMFGKQHEPVNWFSLSLFVVVLAIFGIGLQFTLLGVLSFMFPDFALEIANAPSLFPENTGNTIIYLVSVFLIGCILTPFVEEIVFRGVLLNKLAYRFGVKKSVIISSLLFGALHVEQFVPATLFGIVMAGLYIRTRSLFVPMIFHALNNGIGFLGVAALTLWPEQEVPFTLEDLQAGGLVGFFVSLGCLLIASYFIKRYWPRKDWHVPYCVNK